MPKPPVHTIHILYDDSIDDGLLVDHLRWMAERIAANPTIAAVVRLSVMRMGLCLKGLLEPEAFAAEMDNPQACGVNLRRAFEQVVSDYGALEKNFIGMKDPEILILLGAKPVSDWALGLKQVVGYCPLILTYWLSQGPLVDRERRDLEVLLSQISPPDPEHPQNPRYRICELHNDTLQSLLKEIFTKLTNRIGRRYNEPKDLGS